MCSTQRASPLRLKGRWFPTGIETATLFGAVEQIFQSTGQLMDPADRAPYAESLAAVRAADGTYSSGACEAATPQAVPQRETTALEDHSEQYSSASE